MASQSPDAAQSPNSIAVHHFYDPFPPLDQSTPISELVTQRLRDELFIWFTTIDEHNVPQPLPVTFLWDAHKGSFLTYSRLDRGRLSHLEHHTKVSLHFDLSGGDILIMTGEAHISTDDPASDQIPAWVEKYAALYARLGMTPKQSAESAVVPIRIRPLTLRYSPNPK